MDFFKSQESLTAMEWVLRSVVSFIFLLFITKPLGQRSISQLRFLDFLIAMTLGNIIAHPLSDEGLGLIGSMITTATIILLYVITTWLGLKWSPLKRYLDPSPVTLIKNGQIQFHNLSKAKISIEYLFSELRKEKVEDFHKVSIALWEPGGTISIFMDPQYLPLTPSNMEIKTSPFALVRPIIIDGNVDMSFLQESGRNMTWLMNKLGHHQKELHQVQLATMDEKGNVRVYRE